MRFACGLPVEDAAAFASRSTGGPSRVSDHATDGAVQVAAHGVESVGSRRVPHGLQSKQEILMRCHVSLQSRCLRNGLDLCSEYHVGRLPLDVWPHISDRDRVGAIRQLKAKEF